MYIGGDVGSGTGAINSAIQIITHTITKTIHDTAFIVDRQKQNIDAKTIQNQALTIAALNQNIIDLNATIKKQGNKIFGLWVVILGLVGLVAVFAKSYFK